jgi:SAM-dependent methyltransferase
MKLGTAALEHSLAYRLSQAPFAEKKLGPLFAHNDLRAVRRVLDVGCGPGTNTRHFSHADYVGVDINPRYIAYARRRYGREFLVADVTAGPDLGSRFDCVLVNSFLHHVADREAHRILVDLAPRLTPDGHVHVLELVLPARRSIARLLARLDRGAYARPLDAWRTLLAAHFEPVVFEPYELGTLGVTVLHMVYFKGRAPAR